MLINLLFVHILSIKACFFARNRRHDSSRSNGLQQGIIKELEGERVKVDESLTLLKFELLGRWLGIHFACIST